MSQEELFDNLDKWTIGLDETFQFHCTQCGKCCINREDILLNPRDMYHIAKYLKITPQEVLEKYCETYIGDTSRMPIVRLKPIGKTKRCPFLKDFKCEIHPAKPSVCAIYPLGRYTKADAKTSELDADGGQIVHYILQPAACGDTSETHTVREWLKDFDFEVEDKAHIIWNKLISRTGHLVRAAEEKVGTERVIPLWNGILVGAYLAYDTDKEFLPQLEKNDSSLRLLYDKLEKVLNIMPENEANTALEGENTDG